MPARITAEPIVEFFKLAANVYTSRTADAKMKVSGTTG
jgi:hypothetical protein